MKSRIKSIVLVIICAALFAGSFAHAALLAYEPFTNSPGTAIIGSSDGMGFAGSWQANSSGGVATNTTYAPGYTDTNGNVLLTAGGAGFFQGLTTGNTSMQPYRLFNFSRGTNGTDGVTTWISFLVVRQGPTGTLAGNPYGRGANVCHDFNASTLQKLAIGNSSGVATNTVGLIPQGASGNLRSSAVPFGNYTNFVVVRIDHNSGALDSAWLFVNPRLDAEPSTASAEASSVGGFDFSFDRLRIFAGGQSSAAQPYAEMIVDEYRVGETYPDVTPHTNSAPVPPAGPLAITNFQAAIGSIILSGTGGYSNGTCYVLAGPDLAVPGTNWPAVASNSFNAAGNFNVTSPITPGSTIQFYRVLADSRPLVAPTAPLISGQPQNQSVTVGQNAVFSVVADGTAPLFYQWYFNTNTLLAGSTGMSLTITNAQITNAGTYLVVVSNSVGSTVSTNAWLMASPAPIAPSLNTQPQSLTVTQGQNAAFSVAADGTAPLFYRWYFNTNTLLAGATNYLLAVTNAQAADAGTYSVVVTNAAGSAASTDAVLTVLIPPHITSQPQNVTVAVSNNATFSVTADGTAPLSYKWFFNTNTLLAYATGPTLTITNAQFADAGTYSVVVSGIGSVASDFTTLTVNLSGLVPGAYFVSPSGSDANPGTEASPFKTITNGLARIGSGGVVYLRGGTYAMSYKLTLAQTASPNNRIRLWAYPGENPVVNSAGNSSDGVSLSGKWYYLKGLTVMNAGHNGINISGASNIVELCITCTNSNTGLHITGTTNTAYNLILNCDSYRNYDAATHGQNADGFSAKWIIGLGNTFSGCRAWDNADDGWDLWMATNTVVITNCWAYRQGTNVFGDAAWEGNGNGFKLGGNYVPAPHRLVRSLAFLNMANGIDQNNNTAGQTVDNCTAWANRKANFNLKHGSNTTPHVVRNNISFAGASSDAFTSGTLFTNNSWDVFPSSPPTASDFQSMDYSLVTGPRQADGSLPELPFLHPVSGGRLIDQGVDTGDPYSGSAPDLGAFEVE